MQQIKEETDSDEDTSSEEEDEYNATKEAERVEKNAQRYTEMRYDNEKTAEEVNYDGYHFSVAQKYDLTQRRQTFKKVKYIKDELLLDLKWRVLKHFDNQTKTLKPVHTILLMILALFFLRSIIHYTG